MNSINVRKPQKNKFDLSREVKMSGNMGNLYPCFIQDIIPGDSFRVNTQQMVRFSPLLAPMMHNVDFKLDYFFVPYRLVWDEWKDFITGGEDGNDLPSYPRIRPYVGMKNKIKKGTLADYLGLPVLELYDNLPVSGTTDFELSVLPFRAYQLIWHEYFRDQNVGDEFPQYTTSGVHSSTTFDNLLDLRKSNWEKDYFTSALPFLQRGTAVELPLGNVVPTSANSNTGDLILTNGVIQIDNPTGTYDSPLTLEALTINELRRATALQRWLELMARAGSRYREQIFAIFGERIPDYTVQVPQYLGGGKTPVMISEVLSTYSQTSAPASGGTTDRPMGDMAGHALALGDNIGFQQSFDEHGIILGLCRVIPKTSYSQGVNKFWRKFDKFDHYFPQFANLGEQEIDNLELYYSGNTATDDGVFGYQQRYAEYKYAENRIAGDFRDELAHWELSRKFSATPLLNQSFIECSPDDRIFAITDPIEDKIWISLYHQVDALRPIPYHSNPSLS